MKKIMDVIITVLALAGTVLFVVLTGSSFAKLQAGPVELSAGETLAQAAEAGTYITFEARPMGSYEEEYYADGSRVKRIGYVAYDGERGVFLYVIVDARRSAAFNNLMRNGGSSEKTASVAGTIAPMDDEMSARTQEILKEYLEHGITFASDSEEKSLYQTMRTTANTQTEWYYMEDGEIDGLKTANLWISMTGAVVCLVIFLDRIVWAVTRKEEKCPFGENSASGLERFLAAQWGWVVSWVQHSDKRNRKGEYAMFIVPIVALLAIGIAVGADTEYILTMHVPIGLMIGEVANTLTVLLQRKTMKPSRLMLKYRDGIVKALPSPADQERFAEELSVVDSEWTLEERAVVHYTMFHFIVGPRYWVFFAGGGGVQVIDSHRLRKIRTVAANIFPLYFWYQDNTRSKADEMVPLRWESTQGKFILMAKERLGYRKVEFEAK